MKTRTYPWFDDALAVALASFVVGGIKARITGALDSDGLYVWTVEPVAVEVCS